MSELLYPVFDAPINMEGESEQRESYDANLKTVHFDFEKMDVVMGNDGKVPVLNGAETYRQWVIKIVLTERYKYLVYNSDIGTEIEEIVSHGYHRDVAVMEVKRSVIEAIKIDPRTIDVISADVTWQGDEFFFDFIVDSVFGRQAFYIGGGNVG